MRSNVKWEIYAIRKGTTVVGPVMTKLCGPFEGVLQDTKLKTPNIVKGSSSPQIDSPESHRLLFTELPYYDGSEYKNEIDQYLAPNAIICITHEKHSKLNLWKQLATKRQYVVYRILDSDLAGGIKTVSLKEM